MSNERFTKGPWGFYYAGGSVEDEGCGIICKVGDDWGHYHNAEANAALIAVAPEMYGMLEYVKRSFELMVELEIVKSTRDEMKVDISAIDALLAKARGEQ